MRKIVMLVFIVVLTVISTMAECSKSKAAQPAKSKAAQPTWLVLTNAYPERNENVIRNYAHSSDKAIRLYATALLGLSRRHFSSLPEVGEVCYKAKPKNAADAAAYFLCLLAVSKGLKFEQRKKLCYVWRAKAISFYEQHGRLIDEATGTDNPANIKSIHYPDPKAIKKWPKQTIVVANGWSGIPLRNGTATAYVDGKPMRVQIDTGDTGISISKKAIKRYGLGSALVPMGVRSGMSDNTHEFTSNLYSVKIIRIGPIVIANAFVSVVPRPHMAADLPGSTIGINVLSALGRFAISASKISRFHEESDATCGHMMFTRNPLAEAIEYPFFEVTTNAGRLGLWLDSGFREFALFRRVGVNLSPREKSNLANKSSIRVAKKNVLSYALQNGKKSFSLTDIFDISVAGISTQGKFMSDSVGRYDPMVAGAMTFNFLKKAKVAYDFPDRKMCIIPDSQPTSPASAQSQRHR